LPEAAAVGEANRQTPVLPGETGRRGMLEVHENEASMLEFGGGVTGCQRPVLPGWVRPSVYRH